MSFLKITYPKKGEFVVNEFLKTWQNIQRNVGDLSTQYELSKLFKPVTDMQKYLKEGLVSELKPVRGMKNLPKAITFPQYPSITAYDEDGEEEVYAFIGIWLALIIHLDCGIRMVSFALGTGKQK